AIAKKRAEEEPGNARRQVEFALALAGAHKLSEAEAAIAAALLANPLEPDALFLRAKVLRAKHDEDGARRVLVDMVRMGIDGYAVRMMLADLALSAKRSPGARSELLIAHEYDPTMVEALQALYDLDHKEGRESDALGWLQKLAPLDQHDRKTHK